MDLRSKTARRDWLTPTKQSSPDMTTATGVQGQDTAYEITDEISTVDMETIAVLLRCLLCYIRGSTSLSTMASRPETTTFRLQPNLDKPYPANPCSPGDAVMSIYKRGYHQPFWLIEMAPPSVAVLARTSSPQHQDHPPSPSPPAPLPPPAGPLHYSQHPYHAPSPT